MCYALNIGVDKKDLRSFTECLIKHTNGKTSVFYQGKTSLCNCNTQLSNLSNLNMISKAIGLTGDIFSSKPCRVKPVGDLVPGAHWSHIKSYASIGDGEVLPENALENLSRSDDDMTEEEEKRLRFN
jgi:hypothetical protein